jgi:hypothetical protein
MQRARGSLVPDAGLTARAISAAVAVQGNDIKTISVVSS